MLNIEQWHPFDIKIISHLFGIKPLLKNQEFGLGFISNGVQSFMNNIESAKDNVVENENRNTLSR